MELISVIMPIYNSRQFLSIAIERMINLIKLNTEIRILNYY